MEYISRILRQKILVVYRDNEWKNKIFNKILALYPIDTITKHRLTAYNSYIELVDGTTIRFVYANEHIRGIKANKIIVQNGIDEEILNKVVRPALICLPMMGMIFTEKSEELIPYDKLYRE